MKLKSTELLTKKKKKKPWESLKAACYKAKGQNRKSVSDPARAREVNNLLHYLLLCYISGRLDDC